MSTIQNSSSLSQVNAAQTAASGKSTAKETEDRFLQLLVTQMKNQDPLNPMDNAEITSQMAQLSTVEGIDKLNGTAQSLSSSLLASQTVQAASLVGHGVLAPAVVLEICTRRLVGLNCTSTRVPGTSVGLSPEVISPSWALVSAVIWALRCWVMTLREDVGQVAAQPLPDGPHRHNAHRCHVAPCRAQRDLRLWRGPAARRSCQRLLGGQQPQPLVGDGQLLDGDLARLGVEFGAADLGRQAAIEHPARPHRPVRAHHVDHPVVARDGALAIDDALHPVPQLGVHATVAVGPVEHAALEDDGLELGAADAAHRAVVATAFLVFLDVHLDLEPGALLEGAAPVGRRP